MSKLKVAVCQHSLSGEINQNLRITKKLLVKASKSGADIALFPECGLTGYAGLEFEEYSEERENTLKQSLEEVKNICNKLSIHALVGGYYFEKSRDLPYNSLFLINSSGEEELRYDKRMLTAGDSGWDTDYFTKGDHTSVFSIKGIKCGLLICHEWRYPELYREYKSIGVQVILQSWYDASVSKEEYSKVGKDHGSLIMGAVRSNAANNYLWIAGTNASNPESSIGSFIVQPDGVVVDKLPRNKSGVLIKTIDLSEKYIDPSAHNRKNILNDKRLAIKDKRLDL